MLYLSRQNVKEFYVDRLSFNVDRCAMSCDEISHIKKKKFFLIFYIIDY